MVQPVSLPSRLRREIVALLKLYFQINENIEVSMVKAKVVDLACSALQVDQHLDEMDSQISELIDETDNIEKSVAGNFEQASKFQQLKRHTQDICSICLNPALLIQLQQEKFSLPSYSNLTDTVFYANGQLMAESIRLFLESFGIQAILGRESAGVVYGLTVGPLGEVDIKTAHETATDAKILLDAMQKGYFVAEGDTDSSDTENLEEEISDNEL
jgi:hypothetical protein